MSRLVLANPLVCKQGLQTKLSQMKALGLLFRSLAWFGAKRLATGLVFLGCSWGYHRQSRFLKGHFLGGSTGLLGVIESPSLIGGCRLLVGVHHFSRGHPVLLLPGVSMTLQKWLVITQNNGVMDPFFKGHGDSR